MINRGHLPGSHRLSCRAIGTQRVTHNCCYESHGKTITEDDKARFGLKVESSSLANAARLPTANSFKS